MMQEQGIYCYCLFKQFPVGLFPGHAMRPACHGNEASWLPIPLYLSFLQFTVLHVLLGRRIARCSVILTDYFHYVAMYRSSLRFQ